MQTKRNSSSPQQRSGDQAIVRDERGQEQPADRERARHAPKTPAAGPHNTSKLTDPDKTPGAGTLPKPDSHDDSTTG